MARPARSVQLVATEDEGQLTRALAKQEAAERA
jgi:hypothetical protein